MRRFIEKLSRKVILKRKLPRCYDSAPIYVSPDAGLRFWSPNSEKWDVMLFHICDEFVKSDSVVWDVGANVGLFTFPAAIRAGKHGKVLAIEPDIFFLNLLQKTISKGKKRGNKKNRDWAQIDLLPLAISDKVGTLEFNIAERSRSRNFISGLNNQPFDFGGVRESKTVMGVTLDWLLDYYPAPSIIKIDVECAEEQVLKGASMILEKIKPIIIFECGVPPEYFKPIIEIFNNFNYKIYSAEVEATQRTELTQLTTNNIAIPL